MAEVIGRDGGLAGVYSLVRQIAPTRASVLIQGETGTGKEIIAREIHALSSRREAPFVRVNCGVFQAELLASELFGHEKGAFTGAHEKKLGRLDRARGGTLFLDEVGEISADLQVKLLHVLQDQQYERVGGNETLQADVRLLFATNKDLREAVGQKRFRADLFYRMNVVNLVLPPLRSRREDIFALTEHYLNQYNRVMGKKIAFETDAVHALLDYDWPGNVRELRNLIERFVTLSPADYRVTRADLAAAEAVGKKPAAAEPQNIFAEIREERRRSFCHSLRASSGNISEAARALGLPRTTFRRQLKKLGLVNGPIARPTD